MFVAVIHLLLKPTQYMIVAMADAHGSKTD
jgi:hypothetical protein